MYEEKIERSNQLLQQVGEKDFGINPPASASQFYYANEGIVTFNDLKYETDWNKKENFEVDIGNTLNKSSGNNGTWITSTNFNTLFPYSSPPLLLALPEHTYDISNVFMMNDRFKDSFNNTVKVYSINQLSLVKNSNFATLTQTAQHVLGDATYLNELDGSNVGFTTQEDPGYDIIYKC